MKLPISDRLLACCDFISQNERVADIGCDHGYLAIHLLQSGKASSVIASDIKQGPLDSALRNAEKYGVRDKIAFYLSDGVRSIPRDFDTLVCAGMGGDTMISILEAAPWLKSSQYRLVLQCQSKTPMLRSYLSQSGWNLEKECVLRDGRFLYTVMALRYDPGKPLTPAQCHFPPSLLDTPTDTVAAYYRWVIGGLELACKHRSEPQLQNILTELRKLPENYPFLEE